ncbi:MAG: LacI family DNA-binding transcriptional regulator [Propionibacteriaceae bacterium]|nr:LacI family DNA-binding transcriptional regulator [Propionibacteriaceae bacterium]
MNSIGIRDIARAAGVSTATVSRALRGFATVDPELRDHVLAVAERLNYVGSPAAAALSTGKMNAIGIITPHLSRWSTMRMVEGIERELRGSGIDLVLYSMGDPNDPHPRPPIQRLRTRVDAFVAMSVAANSPDLEALLAVDVPVCLIGTESEMVSCVLIDDTEGARTATAHLLGLGHTRIGLIYGRQIRDPLVLEQTRYLGYLAALGGAGLESSAELEVSGGFTIAGGEQAMMRLLDLPEPPTAVFAMSDEMAFGALRALDARGLTPGSDIALVGFDGHDMADYLGLSTIAQPLEQIGTAAAKVILQSLDQDDRPPTKTILGTQLIARRSTQAR